MDFILGKWAFLRHSPAGWDVDGKARRKLIAREDSHGPPAKEIPEKELAGQWRAALREGRPERIALAFRRPWLIPKSEVGEHALPWAWLDAPSRPASGTRAG